MIISSMRHGLCNIRGFGLDGQSYRAGWATSENPNSTPGGSPAFFGGMVASFQIPGTTPLEELSVKEDKSSALVIGTSDLRKVRGMSPGPVAPWLRMACLAVSSSWMVKGKQCTSAAVGNCCASFRWRS